MLAGTGPERVATVDLFAGVVQAHDLPTRTELLLWIVGTVMLGGAGYLLERWWKMSDWNKTIQQMNAERLPERTLPSLPPRDAMFAALLRLADPDDPCHEGVAGPWHDLAQQTLFGRPLTEADWYQDGKKLTIQQIWDRHGTQTRP